MPDLSKAKGREVGLNMIRFWTKEERDGVIGKSLIAFPSVCRFLLLGSHRILLL